MAGIALLALVGAGWLLSRAGLGESSNTSAQWMPAGPDAYFVLHPSASHLARLSRSGELEMLALPLSLFGLFNPEYVSQSFDEFNIDFERDIRPWLGQEVAAAVYGMEEGDTALAVLVATRDNSLSDEFLRDLEDAIGDEGFAFDQATYRGVPVAFVVEGSTQGLSLATVDQFVVGASSLEMMKDVIDAAQERSARLADDMHYQALMERLPNNRLGALYLGELGKVLADELNVHWLPATEALGAAAVLEPDGIRLDVVQEIDIRRLDGDALTSLQRAATDNRMAKMLPRDVLIMTSGSDFSMVWRQLGLDIPDLLESDPDQFLSDFRDAFGVDLENDLFDRLVGGYAVAVLDNSDRTVDWPGDSPASFLLLLEVADEEQRFVDDAMQDLLQGLEAPSEWYAESQPADGGTVYTIANGMGAAIAGYTLRDGVLWAAIGESAVDAMIDPSEVTLAQEDAFRQSVASRPQGAQSVFFIDTQRLVRVIDDEAGGNDQEDNRGSVAWGLAQLHSLSSASAPVDDDGYQTTVIYLHMPNP